jgi:hypothetical protein
VALPLFAADVYRSIDENGNAVYRDRPDGELITVTVPRPATPAPTASTSRPQLPAGATGSREITTESEPERRRVELTADERAEKCTQARERVQRYNVSHRLYRTGADGEREYLNDAEIDEARARAAADVENSCG